MSWKIQVQADATGTWTGNGIYFHTKPEAESYARDLEGRWMAVRDTRVIEEPDIEPNYRWDGGILEAIEDDALEDDSDVDLCGALALEDDE